MTIQWLYVVMVCVATHRATRLITRDDFPPIAWLREGIIGWAYGYGWLPRARWLDRDGDHYFRWHWLADLITCPWCAGVWLAAGITFAADRLVTDGLPGPVLVWATAAAVAGWLGRADDDSGGGGDDDAAQPSFDRSINATPPRPIQQTDGMSTRRISGRDALMAGGLLAWVVGLTLLWGLGVALVVGGIVLFSLGMAGGIGHPTARPETERPRRAREAA